MAVLVQFVVIAAIVVPSFVLFVLHLLVNLRQVNAKWKQNREYRKKRKAGNNLRMFFNTRGEVEKEEVVQAQQLEAVESVFSRLAEVVDKHAFGNPTLYKHHDSLKLARDVAERSKQGVYNFLSLKKADPGLLSSVAGVDQLLDNLLERRELSGDPKATLNRFKEQLAVLHAAFSGSKAAHGSWTYAGDANKGVVEALLGVDKVGKTITSVPEFSQNPIPELTKQATKILKSPWAKQKNSEGPPKPRFVEPLDMADQVQIRAGGTLYWIVELRDKYGLGSTRLSLVLLLTALAAGPVRFVGNVAAVLLGLVLLLEIMVEVLQANEKGNLGGFVAKMKGSAHRLFLPLLLGVLVLFAFLHGRLNTPSNVGELEGKGTFLPLPPQYVSGIGQQLGRRTGRMGIPPRFGLASFLGQSVYISLIYGIMHSNLWILCLLPLPVCYGLQAQLAQRCPSMRWCIPQNPVWLHRMLGYSLIGGLLVTAVLWVVIQGLGCVLEFLVEPQLCDAFEPLAPAGKDVVVLRFQIVWPLMFCFIPLMVFDKYPDAPDKSEEADTSKPSASAAPEEGPLLANNDLEGSNNNVQSNAPPRAPEGPTKGQLVLRFVYKRLVEVCMVTVAAAGSAHALLTVGSSAFVPFLVPLWPIVLFCVVLHIATKFRTLVASRLGSRVGRLDAHGGEWATWLQQYWWEIAYVSHTIGFLTVLLFALYIRIQVFWVGLFSWGLYFYDRWLGIQSANKNTTPIVVNKEKSSYVVNSTEGDVIKASYVRLVVKRPEGFEFKAGQWVHLALPDCGAHLGAPPWLSPMLHWHAFSIASAEHEDDLEFQIAVNGSSRPFIDGQAQVKVFGHSQNFLRLAKRGSFLEWLRPHLVPLFGSKPDLPTCGSPYTASSSGIFINLQGEDGSSLRVLQPQLQWTGRLWNTVQWLLQTYEQSSGETPSQLVRIMGPYGTLPYTCEAHSALMLIGAGVGFPSTGSMLRKILTDNASAPADSRKAVCFMWTASKVDQLLLCFPSLLVDLAKYVHRKSLQDLKSWLTIKIFISSFEAGDFLSIDPGKHLYPEAREMEASLKAVREWLLGKDGDSYDEDGTYIAQGSLGASFADILRCSLFVKEHVVQHRRSLGICFCGPQDLCSWIRSEQANTQLPVKVEFHSECAG